MKRTMKYINLILIVVTAMVLGLLSPCRATWYHVYSDVSSGPNQDDGYDSDNGSGWCLEWWWEYEVSSPDRSANSSGASASGSCNASSGGQVMAWNQADPSISVYTGCTVWGYSAYRNDDPEDPNSVLPYSWSIDGSGSVSASGSVSGDYLGASDSASSSASACGGIDAEGSGSGYAGGDVSDRSNGSADISIGDNTTEDSSSVDDDEYEWYSASLFFNVEGGDGDDCDGTSYTATASVWADCDAGAEVSVSQGYSGSADASSDASFSGSASVSVSL